MFVPQGYPFEFLFFLEKYPSKMETALTKSAINIYRLITKCKWWQQIHVERCNVQVTWQISRSTESTKLILNNQVDTFCFGKWQSSLGPEVQDQTRWRPVPLWPQLFTHNTLLLRIIHCFSQERRVWEQNPTPPRSSQEYIALLRLKKRGGEGESKRKTWQVRTQGKSERPLRKVETSQQLQEEERWERKNRWRNEEHEETMPGGWEKWRETERNWWLPEPPTVPTANEESRTNPSLPSFTEP